MSFVQYLKDTRGELRHVAWPTRVQTVIYTILVIAISIIVSLYLGLFDFAFTHGLGQVVQGLPHKAQTQPLQPAQTTPAPNLIISTSTTPKK